MSDVPVVYLTGNTDEKTQKRAMQTNHHGYLQKPFCDLELHDTIEQAIKNNSASIPIHAGEDNSRISNNNIKINLEFCYAA